MPLARTLRTRMLVDVTEPATLVVKVAAVGTDSPLVTGGSVTVLVDEFFEVTQVVELGVGRHELSWGAQVSEVPAPPGGLTHELLMLRPSRYCPSDVMLGFATGAFPNGATPTQVADYVNFRLAYVPGSSDGFTDAARTLLTGEGVCRDYTHLTVTLCRALGMPARYTCVYAPGLSPMELHAVAEVFHEGRWEAHDATRLAPRGSMVRVATGRDAADSAFLDIIHGKADLLEVDVVATTDGPLPVDDPYEAVFLH